MCGNGFQLSRVHQLLCFLFNKRVRSEQYKHAVLPNTREGMRNAVFKLIVRVVVKHHGPPRVSRN